MAKSAGAAADCAIEDAIELVGNVVAELVDHLDPVGLEPKGPFLSVPFCVAALSVLHAPSSNC